MLADHEQHLLVMDQEVMPTSRQGEHRNKGNAGPKDYWDGYANTWVCECCISCTAVPKRLSGMNCTPLSMLRLHSMQHVQFSCIHWFALSQRLQMKMLAHLLGWEGTCQWLYG